MPCRISKIFPMLNRELVLPAEDSWDGILTIEQHRVPPEEVAEFCSHKLVVILRLSASSMEWSSAGQKLWFKTMPTNSLSLIAKGTRVGWRCPNRSEELVIALDPVFVQKIASHSDHGDRIEFSSSAVFQDPSMVYMLLALQAEVREGCPTGRLYGESLATALAAHLLGRYSAFPDRISLRTGFRKGGLPPARLRHILDYIEAHLCQDISLSHLADLAQLSPFHFGRLFKQSTGLPLHRYVLQRRAARANEMLANGRLSLAEIGYALGYSSQAQFTTMFRKLTGVTPGAYRQTINGQRLPCDVPISASFPNSPLESERRREGRDAD